MLTVTKAWKDALGCINIPYRDRLNPPNDLKIEYEQIDTSAQNSASVAVSGRVSYSDESEVMNLSLDYSASKAVATLEPNEWALDGDMTFIGESDTHAGWVSDVMSKADGTFDANPKLTLTWTSVQTIAIPGLSVWWSSLLNEWASEFKVSAYNGLTLVSQTTFTNNAVTNFYEGAISGYDKVEIEIIKWCLPYRRARIENVCMGFTVYIAKSEVLTAEHSMSSDLLSFTLPDDYFTFDIDNVSEEWNPDNPTGRYAYLLERQRVTVKYAFKINGAYEWHTVGTYFMSDWTTPQNGISASFTARSLIDFMTKKFVPSSITGYTYGDEISLKELATKAFQQAGLPTDADGSVKWEIADELDDIDVVIPYTTSESEGVTTYSWDFDYSCAEVIQLCANAGCAVIRPNENGDICIKMPSQVVGDYYIDQFVAYSNGEYELSKALKTVNINDGELIYTPTGSVDSGEEQAISNPLLQGEDERTAECAWVSDLLLKRKSIDGEFRADPRLQPLDVITNVNKYAQNRVYITDVKWTYAGAFKGTYAGKVLKSIPLVNNIGEQYLGYAYAGEYGGNV